MIPAPIALFVYNRPEHTRKTLESLSKNYIAIDSELYIFADAVKNGANEQEIEAINAVKTILTEKNWCKNTTIIESPANKGLARSIIEGINYVLNIHDKIIVLEDDLVTSPYFLKYMNEHLEIYKDSQSVYSVNGYMFPIDTNRAESVLLPYTSTWGWATWKNRWKIFNTEMPQKESILQNKFLSQRFNLADYPYTSMLYDGNNSWGIKWYYHVFIRNGLGVFPTKSLVQNIGFDGSGVNHNKKTKMDPNLKPFEIEVKHNSTIDLYFYNQYYEFANKLHKGSKTTYEKIIKKLKF